jgi:hypothetical protein
MVALFRRMPDALTNLDDDPNGCRSIKQLARHGKQNHLKQDT